MSRRRRLSQTHRPGSGHGGPRGRADSDSPRHSPHQPSPARAPASLREHTHAPPTSAPKLGLNTGRLACVPPGRVASMVRMRASSRDASSLCAIGGPGLVWGELSMPAGAGTFGHRSSGGQRKNSLHAQHGRRLMSCTPRPKGLSHELCQSCLMPLPSLALASRRCSRETACTHKAAQTRPETLDESSHVPCANIRIDACGATDCQAVLAPGPAGPTAKQLNRRIGATIVGNVKRITTKHGVSNLASKDGLAVRETIPLRQRALLTDMLPDSPSGV